MNNDQYKLTLSFVTPDIHSDEHTEYFPSFQDALEEANDIAFSFVGFPIEDWKEVDFGAGNRLYSYCPNESDYSSRYLLKIVESNYDS